MTCRSENCVDGLFVDWSLELWVVDVGCEKDGVVVSWPYGVSVAGCDGFVCFLESDAGPIRGHENCRCVVCRKFFPLCCGEFVVLAVVVWRRGVPKDCACRGGVA